MKYRNTREERERRGRRKVRVKLCPPAEEGFIKTAQQRVAEQAAAAQNLQALARPMKPPSRKVQL